MIKKIFNVLIDNTPCIKLLYDYYLKIKGREKKISLGKENSDKIFYIIGYNDVSGGLFWLTNKVAMHIAYALSKNYIPIIDYKNNNTQYTTAEELGKINIWEKFFIQPFGYHLEDIKLSKNIIINKKTPAPKKVFLMGQNSFYDNEDRINYFRAIYKKYIIPTEEMKKYLIETESIYFKNKGKILGVLSRGTDYVVRKPKNHPIQPTSEMLIKDAQKIMNSYKCNYVFLATEDEDILEDFKSAFKERLIYLPQKRYKKSDLSHGEFLAQAKNHDNIRNRTEDAKLYYAAIYLLSKCQCFIGGRTGGTKGVLLMEDSFEYKHIYDLGLYK